MFFAIGKELTESCGQLRVAADSLKKFYPFGVGQFSINYLQLPATTRNYLQLPATFRNYLQLSATICNYLLTTR
ncbi:MAG TPA: hypothetical protein VK400_11805 [Pyrinomonadaceae bacterium]|nr:hypothetical protein [Pyrinomonadaceae bacterium]